MGRYRKNKCAGTLPNAYFLGVLMLALKRWPAFQSRIRLRTRQFIDSSYRPEGLASENFEKRGRTHAAGNAHRHHGVFDAAQSTLEQHVTGHSSP
jgi:hypothetical protein